MGIAKYATRYMCDLFSMERMCRKAFANVTGDAAVDEYISTLKWYKRPFSSIAGLMMYDMIPGADSARRQDAGILTTKTYMAIDLADEIVDTHIVHPQQSWLFIEGFRQNMFIGYENKGRTLQEYVAYSLGKNLYDEVFFRDEKRKSYEIAGLLIDSVKNQAEICEPERILEMEKLSGALTFDILWRMMELLAQKEFPHLRESIRCIGEYAEMIDGASDVDEDLACRVNTYATATIRKEGDSMSVRRLIRRAYMRKAAESFSRGASYLSEDQREIYDFMKAMIDTYYIVFQGIISRRIRTPFVAGEKLLSRFS